MFASGRTVGRLQHVRTNIGNRLSEHGRTRGGASISDTILCDVANGVATVTLNRPDKLNAFNDEMLHALTKTIGATARDDAVRCVVITGTGRGFSAGQDLSSLRDRSTEATTDLRTHLERTYNRLIRLVRATEKPVVAAVNGVAAGAGMSLALACDIRLAAESARFIQSFSGVGLVPDSGSTWLLQRMVGQATAFELAVTAEPVSAGEALSLRLVNHVYPDARFSEEARDYAQRLASGPTKAYGLTKRAMNRAWTTSLDDALSYEARLQQIASDTVDHHVGVNAFLEKRRPEFVGR